MCFLSLFFLPEASDFGPHGLIIAWPPAKAKWKTGELFVLAFPILFDFKVLLSGAFVFLFARAEVRGSTLEAWVEAIRVKREGNCSVIGEGASSSSFEARRYTTFCCGDSLTIKSR
jgi:hypothetical protein